MWNELKRYIPTDHARQVQDKYYVDRLMKSANPPRRILDLGCGTGDSIDLFRRYGSESTWKGSISHGRQKPRPAREQIVSSILTMV